MRKALALILAVLPMPFAAAPAAADTLVEALILAYQTNPDLRARRAALRATDEGVARATAGYLPSLTGTGNFSRQNVLATSISPFGQRNSDVDSSPRFYEARIDQPIFRGFQTRSGRKQAKSQVMVARAQLFSTEQTVFLDTVTAYMDVLRDEAVLGLDQNNIEVLQRQLEASQDRFRVGEITRTDVAQSRARLAGAVSTRVSAEADLAASRARFRQIVGQQSGTLEPPPELPELPIDLEAALEIGSGRNPSIAIARHNEEAADFAIDRALGVLAPTVDGFARISRFEGTSAFGADTVDIIATTKVVGVQIRVPLFQGGGEYSDIRQARELRSQRRLEVLSADRQVSSRVRTAWERYRAAQSSIISNQAQVDANEIALDGVRQEAAVGSRTTLNVLDAEQELLDARVQLVRAEREEYVAGFELLASTGGLNVAALDLPVEKYDPERHYDKVKNKFIGWGTSDD